MEEELKNFIKEQVERDQERAAQHRELIKIMSELLAEVKQLRKLGEHYKAFHK